MWGVKPHIGIGTMKKMSNLICGKFTAGRNYNLTLNTLDRLIEWGWVRAAGYKGEIFELTGTGYSKADWLKDGMGIDTSKAPLDELKEFGG